MHTHFRQHGFEPWRVELWFRTLEGGALDHDTTSSATHVGLLGSHSDSRDNCGDVCEGVVCHTFVAGGVLAVVLSFFRCRRSFFLRDLGSCCVSFSV